MLVNFAGKRIVITGAYSGIGAALVELLRECCQLFDVQLAVVVRVQLVEHLLRLLHRRLHLRHRHVAGVAARPGATRGGIL